MTTETVAAGWTLVVLCGAVLLIALAVAIIRHAARRTPADFAPDPIVPAWPETFAEHPMELAEHTNAMFDMLARPSLRVLPGGER